jgi:hypothetical protein
MRYNSDNRLEVEARGDSETLVPKREGKLSSNNKGTITRVLKDTRTLPGAEPGFGLKTESFLKG